MSVDAIRDTSSAHHCCATESTNSGVTETISFTQTLLLQISGMQSDSVNTLAAADNGKASDPTAIASLLSSKTSCAACLLDILRGHTTGGLSSTGRNQSLFDPESAYRMMSFINRQDVTFQAQYSELSGMGDYVHQLQQSAAGLQGISTATSSEELKGQLQQFVTQYNDWITHFAGDMSTGGALNNVQAAEVSRYELEQSVKNMFNGAADGFKGLASLGISIDDSTHLATLDSTQLDAALASNKEGVMHTVQQFAGNFAKSAELLTSDGNFISNQLANLSSAIHYIDSNESAWQSEFGKGDSYQAPAAIAEAAAAYRKSHST